MPGRGKKLTIGKLSKPFPKRSSQKGVFFKASLGGSTDKAAKRRSQKSIRRGG